MFVTSLMLRWLQWFCVGIIHKIIIRRMNWEFEREIVGVKNACYLHQVLVEHINSGLDKYFKKK